MNELKLIPNWQDYGLHCMLCGTDKSVKYFVDLNINGRKGTACMCNGCVARRIKNDE